MEFHFARQPSGLIGSCRQPGHSFYVLPMRFLTIPTDCRRRRQRLHELKFRLLEFSKAFVAYPMTQHSPVAGYPAVAPCADDFHFID